MLGFRGCQHLLGFLLNKFNSLALSACAEGVSENLTALSPDYRCLQSRPSYRRDRARDDCRSEPYTRAMIAAAFDLALACCPRADTKGNKFEAR